jgi:hypothetical protein
VTDPAAFRLVAAEYAEVATRVVTETGELAEEVARSWRAGTYDGDAYVSAAAKLLSIGVTGGLGLLGATITSAALLGGLGRAVPYAESGPLVVEPAETDRPLAVAAPLTLVGGGRAIASGQVRFRLEPPPPDGATTFVLPRNRTSFVVLVPAAGVASGTYGGAVRIGAARVVDVVVIV